MRHVLLLPLLCLLSLPSAAHAGQADDDLRMQRNRFLSLYIQAQSGRWLSIRPSADSLKNYPLYPYLEAANLQYRLRRGDVQDRRLVELFARHPDLGAADPLREAWLRNLARRGEWKKFVEFYQPAGDTELRCLHARALIQLGRSNEAALEARALWLNAKSQPRECDSAFAWMENVGRLTPELVATRAKLSMIANETRMVQVLSRKLTGSAKLNAERWLEMRRNPLQTLQKLIDHPQRGLEPEVVALGLRLAARQHTLRAAKLYPGLARHYLPTTADRDMALGYLCLEMALDRDREALEWCSKPSQNPVDATARDWRLRTAIYHGAWDRARNWIEQLPDAERTSQRWRYWLARSYEGIGGPLNQVKARARYSGLAVERGYYAYLAADRLGNSYALNHQPTPQDPVLRKALESRPGVARAREFLALDLQTEARREWRHFIRGQSAQELQLSGAIAHEWGWHYEAIVTQAKSEYWDDLELRYPLLYRNELLSAAGKAAIDTSWAYGIMRAESLYRPDARSPAGAIGLMQLLPRTARSVALKIGLSYTGSRTLLDPSRNMRLGTAYLRQMQGRFSGNRAMATAAYNAGPHRVQSWMPRTRMPGEIWVENIPFNETRRYVQHVMEHAVAFDWRLKRKTVPLSERVPPVPPK